MIITSKLVEKCYLNNLTFRHFGMKNVVHYFLMSTIITHLVAKHLPSVSLCTIIPKLQNNI